MVKNGNDLIEKKRLAILSILKEANKPLGSEIITELLKKDRHDISERTVRFHLLAMDKDGLTECVGRQGRRITEKGIEEHEHARVYEKLGFLAAKIDEMSFRMRFNLRERKGTVVINMSVVELDRLMAFRKEMLSVFQAGYSMGRMLAFFKPGEQVGEVTIPPGMIGVGTVCSITINGVLVSHGIPVFSRFGGLLEYRDRRPARFTAIINYDGTTLDPLEIFIKSGMTDYRGAVATGNGRIGAGFREMPSSSRDRVLELAGALGKAGLGGILEVGFPGRDLLGIPINEGRLGSIVIGGLNPMAILEEYGVDVHSRALSAIVDFDRLFPFTEAENRLKRDFDRV